MLHSASIPRATLPKGVLVSGVRKLDCAAPIGLKLSPPSSQGVRSAALFALIPHLPTKNCDRGSLQVATSRK
eukprot:4439153-Alexandrium_andersonii.AAC.1